MIPVEKPQALGNYFRYSGNTAEYAWIVIISTHGMCVISIVIFIWTNVNTNAIDFVHVLQWFLFEYKFEFTLPLLIVIYLFFNLHFLFK